MIAERSGERWTARRDARREVELAFGGRSLRRSGRRKPREPGGPGSWGSAARLDRRARAVSLAAAPAASRARGDSSSLELLEVLEHADHRVASRGMRLVGDRAAEADPELGAELGLDQAVRAERLLGVVVAEVGFTASCRNPHRSECSSPATGLRDGKVLDRASQPLPNQRYRRQCYQTIIVVVGPT